MAAGDIDAIGVVNFEECASFGWGDVIFFACAVRRSGGGVLEDDAGDGDILAVGDLDAGCDLSAFGEVVVAEAVGADGDVAAVFEADVVCVVRVDEVSGECEASAVGEVDSCFLVADDVAGDGPHAGGEVFEVFFSEDSDVAACGGGCGLDGIRGDGHFAYGGARGGGVDPYFGGGFGFGFVCAVVVVFDVVAGDLKISDFGFFDTNAAEAVVADV